MVRSISSARSKTDDACDRTFRRRRRCNTRPSLEFLEDRIAPTVDVWTGASSNLWSDAGNWTLGAPTAGEDLDFPANAANKTSVYDSGLGVSSFGSITIDGSGYDISSSFASSLTLTSGFSTTYGSAISNFDIDFDPGNGTVSLGAGGTLELGGVIAGTSGLAVSGAGTLQLGGTTSNTYTGATTVANTTTLVLDKSGATAVPGALSINAGGTVRLAQSDQIADAVDVAIGTGATLNLNNFSDTLNTLTLTGATVSTGTGTLTLGGNVTTLASSSTSIISGKLDLGGATRTFFVADGSAGTDLTVSANISGTGAGIIKAGGASAMSVSGNNTYDGTTTVNTGGLIIANANALGATSAGTIVSSGATLGLQGGITVAAEPLTISGNGVGNLGAIWGSSGANTLTGSITLAAASYIGAESAAPLTISGQITDGASSFALTKVRSGTVTLTAANSYDGGTTVSAGTLTISNGGALGTGAATVSNNTTLKLGGGITAANALTISGTGVSSVGSLANASGDNTLSGPITLATNSAIGSLGGNLTFSGAISDGASSFALTKVQSGTVTLAGANTYKGDTTVVSGYLEVTADNGLGDPATPTTVTVEDSATLELSGGITLPVNKGLSLQLNGVGGTAAKVITLGGDNTIDGAIVMTGNEEFQQVDGTTLRLNGVISESASGHRLISDGAGELILNATNTYTGTTFVTAGTLLVDGSIATSSDMQVYDATLGGSGTAPDVTVGSGSTLAPGDSPGLLNTGNLTFQSGSTYSVQLNGTTVGSQYDQTNVTGSVALAGATLSVSLGYTPAIGDTFTIIDKQNSGAVTGVFHGLPEGALFTSGIATYQVTYSGGNGNDVDLDVVAVRYTWTGLGGDNNWSTAANWDTNQAPAGGEDLVFPSGAARLSNNNDLSGKSFRSIEIDGGGFSISGNAVTLTNGISSTFVSDTSEFQPGIALTATETVDVVNGGDLILSGAISGSGFGITKAGGGTLEYTGFSANTYSGTTTVDAGTLILNRSSGLNAIAGNLVIGDNIGGGESVQIGSNNQIADTSAVTVNEGATLDLGTSSETFATLTVQGASVTVGTGGVLGIANTITSNLPSTDATSTISGAGTLALSNPNGTLLPITVAQDTNANVDLRISANITGSNRGIQKLGNGTLALAGTASTYDGNTNAEGGIIQVEADAALGNTNTVVIVTNGSVDFAGANLSIDRGFSIAGGAGFNGGNAINVLSGSTTLTGSIGLFAAAQVGAASGSTLTINGSIFEDIDPPYYGISISNGANGRTILGGDNGGSFQGNIDALSGFFQVANDNALGMSAVATTITIHDSASLELAGGVTIPSSKTIAISGVPVANSSKIISVSGNNTILSDIGITGGNNESFDVANGTTLTVSGVISGSLDFDKNNTGTLILTGTNTNTGNVNVGDGSLIVNGSLAAANSLFVDGTLSGTGTVPGITISSIGTLAPGNLPGILHTGDLAFSDSGSTYSVALNGATVGTQYDQTDVTGAVTLAGATLSVSLGFAPASADVFTIINNDGSDPVSGTFNGLPEGSTVSVGNQQFRISYIGGTGNDVTLTAFRVDTWTGAGNNANWTNAANWVGNVAPQSNDQLVFPTSPTNLTSINDFTAATIFDTIEIDAAGYSFSGNDIGLVNGISTTFGSGALTLPYNIGLTQNQSIDVGAGGTLTLSGQLSLAGQLTKTGAGTLSLLHSNTYSGGTMVTAGTLAITDPAALGTGTVTVGDGTGTSGHLEIDLTGTKNVSNTFVINAPITTGLQVNSGTIKFLGGTTLNSDLGINEAANSSLEFAGPINDGGQTKSLTKGGTGTLIFSGVNTYTGTTFVDQGLLQLNCGITCVAGNLTVSGPGTAATVQELRADQIADGSRVNLANAGATLDLNGFSDTIGALSLTGSTVTTGAGTLTVASGGGISTLASSQTATISGNLTFGGPNNYFTVAQGTTQSGVDLAVPAIISSLINIIKAGAGTMALSGANTYSGGTNINSGVLAISNNTGAGTGVVNILGTGTLDLSGGITVSNTLNVASSGTAISNSAGTNSIFGTFNLGANATIATAPSTTLMLSSTVDDSSNSYSLTKTGTGTLEFDFANAYDGGTTVSAGVLAIGNNASLGTGPVVDDAEIDISNNLLLNNDFTLNSQGTALVVNGLTTFQGTVSLTSDATINTPGFANLYLNGVISGSGGLIKNGTGTLGLGQANTYQGGTTANAGFLQVFNGQATGTTGSVTVGSNTTLIQSTNSYSLPSGGLSLGTNSTFLVPLSNSETLSGPISLAGGATFSIASGASLTVLGNIGAGSSQLIKVGSGALVLNGTSSSTGTTNVSVGMLQVDGSLPSSSLTDVQPGGTLTGHGTIGAVQVHPSGTFSPGASPDTITVASLALSSGSNFVEELFGNTPGDGTTGYDQTIVTTGPLSLSGATLNLSLGGGYVPAPGDVLTLIDNQSNGGVNGTFHGLAEGALTTVGGSTFKISYVGGNGNDVTLTDVVPTSTVIIPSPNPSVFGQTVTLTASVTAIGANGLIPTGSITFLDGTTILGTSALDQSGVASLTTAAFGTGIHGITAQYTSTGNFVSGTSPLSLQGVNPATTSLILSNLPTATVFGQSVTFTAVVGVNSPGAGTATGSVWFLEGQTLLGAVQLAPVSGQQTAVFTTSALSAGSHLITAQYVGNASFAASPTQSISQVVSKAETTTALIVGGTTSFGQPATFAAFLHAVAPGAGTPTGSVTFFDGSTALGTAPLSGGVATFATSALAAGTHSITVRYTSGDAGFNAGSTSSAISQVVNPSASTVVINSTAQTSTYGQPVTLTGFVIPVNSHAGAATGFVAFMDGGTVLEYVALEGGVAKLTLNNLNPGARQITVVYPGFGSVGSSIGTLTQVVSPAKTATTLAVQTAGSGSNRTAMLVVGVNVPYPGAIPPSGTAVILMNGRPFRTIQVVNGVATTSIPYSYRLKQFVAVFQSNPYFAGSRSGIA